MVDKDYDYVLIGGGVASASAAETIRTQDAKGSILIVGSENRLPYNRPPLTKEYLKGEGEAKDVPVHPKEWYENNKIDLLLGRTAIALDTSTKRVTLDDGDGVRYGKLLLATGATPIRPKIPGADLPNVQTMRFWEDSDQLQQYLTERLVIIGGGYIGLEVSAVSAEKGGKPVILERGDRLLSKSISPELSVWFAEKLEAAGVQIEFNVDIESITPSGVLTKSGKMFDADHVLLGTGVKTNIELAESAGLAIDDELSGVIVDKYLKTSAPDVWAASDIAAFEDPVMGKRRRIEHYNNAVWHGQVAGTNMGGVAKTYDHVANFYSYELDIQFELFGDPQAGKHMVFHGEPSTTRFDELYTDEEGRVVMVVSVNPPEDLYPVLERLPRLRPSIKGREVEVSNADFDLASLVK